MHLDFASRTHCADGFFIYSQATLLESIGELNVFDGHTPVAIDRHTGLIPPTTY
jgi:hypothetical protein